MLKYDKIIVDASNVYHRVASIVGKIDKEKAKSLSKNNTILQCYVSVIDKLLASTYGEVDVLFDPLLSNGQKSKRGELKKTYKSDRDKNKVEANIKFETLGKLYQQLVIAGQSRLNIYHDVEMEADDFVEKLTEEGKCLMITSDRDWFRYLEDGRVEALHKGLTVADENIYTAVNYEKQYGYKPNISSVTFDKVIYGDHSDGIEGAFIEPKIKVLREADTEMKAILKQIGEENPPLKELKIEFFNGSGRFSKLYQYLQLSSTEKSYEKILNIADANFQLIESFLPRTSDIKIEKFKVELDLTVAKPANKKFTLGKK